MVLQFVSPLHKAIRQISLHLEGRMTELGLSPGECHVLSYLLSYAPCAVSEMVRVFGLKKSTLTGMLDRLTERELLVREVNPKDRRSFSVRLTRAGKAMARRVNRPVEALEESIESRVSARDMAGFRAVMEAIASITSVRVSERDR